MDVFIVFSKTVKRKKVTNDAQLQVACYVKLITCQWGKLEWELIVLVTSGGDTVGALSYLTAQLGIQIQVYSYRALAFSHSLQ